jgi:hypothetical protein
MTIAALFIMLKKWKLKNLAVGEFDKQNVRDLKMGLIHATTWINLDNIMLCETSQSQRATC